MKTIEILARIEGAELKERELVDNWILITYDLPVPDGNKARDIFLKKAPKIGAVMHSRSVYLMPLTPETEIAAYELAKVPNGDVFLWTTKVTNPEIQKKITEFYDSYLEERVYEISKRIEKIQKFIVENKRGLAKRVLRKTTSLFNQLLFATVQRGAKGIITELYELYKNLETLTYELE